jgi:hypothetical protein
MHWSTTVRDYYEVHPKPRWGHGSEAHPELRAVIEQGRAGYEAVLTRMARYRDLLHQVPHTGGQISPSMPYWYNGWFSALDAASLMCFLSDRKPRRYIEVGSGFSTKFARFTISRQSLPTSVTSIDPMPRAEIDVLCDQVVRSRLEDCAPQELDSLSAGDILLFDGSHRVFENSDVTVFFLEILPRLRPGVLVHIHDIFLPFDYIPRWNERLYSEQYLLASMLLCRGPPFRLVLPNYFVCTDQHLTKLVVSLFQADTGKRDIPLLYANGADIPGVSFWIETIEH